MKRIHLNIIGTILSILTGAARAFGGFTLIASHSNGTELGAGIALAVIGAVLIVTGVNFLINMSQKNPRPQVFINILTVAIVAFWVDGIINGFLLYGAPQVSGQIINTVLLIVILLCLWSKRNN